MAFYERDGERFASTPHTRGPWDDASQHAGPPAALLGRAVERCGEPEGRAVARITVEILRPVPLVPLAARAKVVRPGRSVELVEGALRDGDGDVLRARAWRVRVGDVALPGGLPSESPPPGPDAGSETAAFPSKAAVGWHTAMEIRFVGIGLATSTLHDEGGPIGLAAQTLLVRPRGGGAH